MAYQLNSPRKCQNKCITVGTFCPRSPVVDIPVIPGVSTVRSLKKELAKHLGLGSGCDSMFGLFQGEGLVSSMKILQEEDVISIDNVQGENDISYFFQKNPIHFTKEMSILTSDIVARNLVYHELRERFLSNFIYPPLILNEEEKLEQLIEDADSFSDKQIDFITYFWKDLSTFYSMFYHKVDNCTLQSKVTAAQPDATIGSTVSVSVNFNGLIITYKNDKKGTLFHFTFLWEGVRMIDMDRSKYWVIFEIFIEDVPGEKYDSILRAVCIQSARYEYLYSMAKYILLVHQNLLKFEKELYEEQADLEEHKLGRERFLKSRANAKDMFDALQRIKKATVESLENMPSKDAVEEPNEEQNPPQKMQKKGKKKKKRCADVPVVNQARQSFKKEVSAYSACKASLEEKTGVISTTSNKALVEAGNSVQVKAENENGEHSENCGHTVVSEDEAVAYYQRYLEKLSLTKETSDFPKPDVGGNEELLETSEDSMFEKTNF